MNYQDLFYNADDPNWIESIRQYSQKGGVLDRSHPVSGWTLLHLASEMQQYEAIEWLTAQGLDPNARNSNGSTPLHIAVESEIQSKIQDGRKIEMSGIKTLLDAGADPTITNKQGRTPLGYAQGMDDQLEALLSEEKEHSPNADVAD